MINKILQTYLNDNTVEEGGDIIVKEYSPNELSFLKWQNQSKPQPTKEQFDAIKEQLYPSYKEDRANEYPSIQEQLDMQYWDKINGTNIWEETITAIKNKYPKVGS
jgi:hypothetical protein